MSGKIEWIGVRPERKGEVLSKSTVNIDVEDGISGDHPVKPHRQVTIISKEDLEMVRDNLGADKIDPSAARRNIMISGMDFTDLKGAQLELGDVLIEVTGYCHPCSRMDKNLGEGGRSAMAQKAGWTARVVKSGQVSVGDAARLVS